MTKYPELSTAHSGTKEKVKHGIDGLYGNLIEITMSIKEAGDPESVNGEEEGDDFVDAGGDEGEGDEGDEEGLLDEERSNEKDVSMQWFGGREERDRV